MKKFSGSIVVGLLLMSGLAVAGGDIAPVEPEVIVPAPPPVVDDSGFYLGVAYTRAKYKEDYDWYEEMDIAPIGTAASPVFGPMDAAEGSGTEEVDYNGIMAQAGYKFNKYLAVEGRYWWSLGDGDWSWSESYGKESLSGSGSDGNEELRAWGVYLKPMYPVTEQFDIYALLGGGNVTLSNDSLGDWLDENDFQWGLGASYEFTENLSIFVDYVRLLDKDGSSITEDEMYPYPVVTNWDDTVYAVNVGLTYKF